MSETYGRSLRERTYADVVARLGHCAPTMAVSEATKLADELAEATTEAYIAKSALAILSEPLGFSENGSMPDSLKGSDGAIRWALDQVTSCHGWVVCGPAIDGMAKLKAMVAPKEVNDEN